MLVHTYSAMVSSLGPGDTGAYRAGIREPECWTFRTSSSNEISEGGGHSDSAR